MPTRVARSADSNGYLREIDSAGTVRIYDPATNRFGAYNPDGSIRTFFKPDPSGHPYPTNLDYWNAQPGS